MHSYQAKQMFVDASLGGVTTIGAEVMTKCHAVADYPSYFGDHDDRSRKDGKINVPTHMP